MDSTNSRRTAWLLGIAAALAFFTVTSIRLDAQEFLEALIASGLVVTASN